MKHDQQLKYSTILIVIFIITGLSLTACGGETQAKETYTIGVINYVPILDPIFDGFKDSMADLGYIEGENVTYIYNGVLDPDPGVIEREVKSLLDQEVDMFFTMGNPTTLAAKQAVIGTDIPVVFAPVIDPVGSGVVESLRQPGGNVTGVQSINAAPKGLEWLLKLRPGTKTVYVPYHPQDRASVATIKPLSEAASAIGVELMLDEVSTSTEVMAAIKALPKDTAILFVTAPSLESDMSAILNFAVEYGIPAGGYNRSDEALIFTYTTDRAAQGKQAARLADQIIRGTKPADLPVESPEFFLKINLKIAEAVSLDIPENILRQADTVIR